MKTTFDLPDALVKEIKLRAVHEGKKLKDAVAELLRRGLSASAGRTSISVRPARATLARRRELTRKFVSGEWGVELGGYEASRAVDRAAGEKRARAWRR
jgi:hypothetical protein